MQSKILYIFTRTPLHVGAGASVGAIDQPVQRERHTGFPIIPGSSLKGSFVDHWPASQEGENGRKQRLSITAGKTEDDKPSTKRLDQADESAWLFGSDTTDLPFAGSLLFCEARLLAFPVRSAKGSYAWITCPLMLQRAARDGVINVEPLREPDDGRALFPVAKGSKLALNEKQIVLEDYCFEHAGEIPEGLAEQIRELIPGDHLFETIKDRLVILSNGMMSHFVMTACEVAQHVRISDETGTAEEGGLFNQENVPSDTLFYSLLSATKSRVPGGEFKDRPSQSALEVFEQKIASTQVFQFGGDASTGLGFCTVISGKSQNS